ncbi:unnamed protein product [Periconia digitata]|uniref:Uncharacterized protein n=1 Tax=Periconia digitata TaxID=1303443 RepID=A0A9W4U7L9_9PLEO|nr:unnamed protein product [Periconia digitata]
MNIYRHTHTHYSFLIGVAITKEPHSVKHAMPRSLTFSFSIQERKKGLTQAFIYQMWVNSSGTNVSFI